MLRGSDTVQPITWWAVQHLPATDSGSALMVTDPDGAEWVVIQGGFRFLSPLPEPTAEGPLLRLGRGLWIGGGNDDGRPEPGSTREEFVAVDDATLVTLPGKEIGGQCEEVGRRSRFADSFSHKMRDGRLIAHTLTGGIEPVTASLLEWLGARWTGWGLDCIDAEATLVITDPAVGKDGPHAVLVRKTHLEAALKCSERQLTVQITVTDLHAPIHRRSTPRTVTLDAKTAWGKLSPGNGTRTLA